MSEPSLSERLLSLEAHPAAVADLYGAVHDALDADPADPAALRAAAGLSSEATRLTLSWMGHGDTSHLEGLTKALQAALAERGETAPLDGVPPAKRLAARFHELARVVVTYRRTNNTARHVGALAGRRRETWREITKWAYKRGEPFSVAELRDAGFYNRRRESAYEALDQLVGHGLLTKDDVQEPAVFSLTWEGRAACRSLWSPEEIGREGKADSPTVEEVERRLLTALRAHRREKKENARLRSQLTSLSSELQALRSERAALAVNGSLEQRRRVRAKLPSMYVSGVEELDDSAVLKSYDIVEGESLKKAFEATYGELDPFQERLASRERLNEEDW